MVTCTRPLGAHLAAMWRCCTAGPRPSTPASAPWSRIGCWIPPYTACVSRKSPRTTPPCGEEKSRSASELFVKRLRLAFDLAQFRTAGVRRLAAPVLVNRHRLIGVERSAAGGVVGLGHRRHAVSLRRCRHRKHIAVLLARGQHLWDQVRGLWSRASAGRRTQFRQSRGKAAELRQVLRLSGVNRPDLIDHRHFIRIHPRHVKLRHRNADDDENNGNNDQQLDQRKAAGVPTDSCSTHKPVYTHYDADNTVSVY